MLCGGALGLCKVAVIISLYLVFLLVYDDDWFIHNVIVIPCVINLSDSLRLARD